MAQEGWNDGQRMEREISEGCFAGCPSSGAIEV